MEGVDWPLQRPLPEEAKNLGQLQSIVHVTQAQPVAQRIAKLYRSHRLFDAPTLHKGQIRALAIAEAEFEAVIVSSDVAFGLTRMIELMLDDVITIAPFRDIVSARTWLAQSHVARATATPGGNGTDVSTNG